MKYRILIAQFLKPLFNQRGNFDVSDTDYDISSLAEEGGDAGQDDGNQPEGQGESDQPQSLEDQLNSMGEGEKLNPEGGEGEEGEKPQNLLDMVNSLGMIREGLPLEVGSEDQLRDTIMKGMDYTTKTMALAEERKDVESQLSEQTEALETRISDFEKEKETHYETIQENQIFGQIMEQVKLSYPDVYDEIQSAFNQSMGMYKNTMNNPVFQQYNQKISNLENQLKGQSDSKNEEAATQIKTEWDNGLKEVQTGWGAKLKTLGIRPNWSEVQNAWKADSSKTMTVQNALLSVYGDKITKALESQKKLVTTKARSTARTGERPTGETGGEKKAPKYRGAQYMDTLNDLADKYAV